MVPQTLQNSTLLTRILLFSKLSMNFDIGPMNQWGQGNSGNDAISYVV